MLFILSYYFNVYEAFFLHVCQCTMYLTIAHKGLKRVSDPLELE